MIECYNIIGGVNKIMQSSEGMCEFFRLLELKIIIEGKIYKKFLNVYLKSESVPMLGRNFFIKIANDIDNVYNGSKTFIQHCCERHFL